MTDMKQQPPVNKVCSKCFATTQWHRAPERAPLKLCKECYEVHVALEAGKALISCMECDDGKVLTDQQDSCKPCRVNGEDPGQSRRKLNFGWQNKNRSHTMGG